MAKYLGEGTSQKAPVNAGAFCFWPARRAGGRAVSAFESDLARADQGVPDVYLFPKWELDVFPKWE